MLPPPSPTKRCRRPPPPRVRLRNSNASTENSGTDLHDAALRGDTEQEPQPTFVICPRSPLAAPSQSLLPLPARANRTATPTSPLPLRLLRPSSPLATPCPLAAHAAHAAPCVPPLTAPPPPACVRVHKSRRDQRGCNAGRQTGVAPSLSLRPGISSVQVSALLFGNPPPRSVTAVDRRGRTALHDACRSRAFWGYFWEQTDRAAGCTSLLHIPFAHPFCISLLHIPFAYPLCISLMHIPDAYPFCISLLHIPNAYPLCIPYASHGAAAVGAP